MKLTTMLLALASLGAGASYACPPVPAPKPPALPQACLLDPYATDPVSGVWCGWLPGQPGVPDCSRLVC